tara:strand:+ start:344 stop:493 length:150 start_codon:yes stop_codon:yes gene_type:complete
VWYFNLSVYDLELDFLAHISLALESHFYEAQDRFRVRDLTVITRGRSTK